MIWLQLKNVVKPFTTTEDRDNDGQPDVANYRVNSAVLAGIIAHEMMHQMGMSHTKDANKNDHNDDYTYSFGQCVTDHQASPIREAGSLMNLKRRKFQFMCWVGAGIMGLVLIPAAGCHKKKDSKEDDSYIFVETGLSLPDLSNVKSLSLNDTSLIEVDLSVNPPVARHSWNDAGSHSAATESCSKEMALDMDKAAILEYFNGLELCIAEPRILVSHCSKASFSLVFTIAPETKLLTEGGSVIAAYFEPVECEAKYNVLCSASRLKELEASVKEKVGPFSAENCSKVE